MGKHGLLMKTVEISSYKLHLQPGVLNNDINGVANTASCSMILKNTNKNRITVFAPGICRKRRYNGSYISLGAGA